MNAKELADLVPTLINDKLEDVSSATPTMPGGMHDEFPSWWFRSGAVLGVAAIFPKSNELRWTMGLAIDIPYSEEVFREVNRLNNKELVFGRAFLVGNDESGLGAVLLQEIIFGDGISWEYVPSVQNALRIMATLVGQVSRLAPKLLETYDARPMRDDEAFFLQTSG
jgi:hypothetical protein